MAKKGKKSRRRGRRGRKASRRAHPRTVMGQIRQQPLLVKAGIGLSVLDILTGPGANGVSASTQLQAKQYTNALNTVESNAMDLGSYKPLAYGIIGHYIAKVLKVQGL